MIGGRRTEGSLPIRVLWGWWEMRTDFAKEVKVNVEVQNKIL